MNRKLKFRLFLEENHHPPESYYHVLQIFLRHKETRCSAYTVERIYYNLYPIGRETNPPLQSLSREWLREYIDGCWLRYSPETMRTLVGDLRMFFRWAKKRGHHARNIAKTIKPVRRGRRRRRVKAAPESDIKAVMVHLAGRLKTVRMVYQDLFGALQGAAIEQWDYEMVKVVRDLFILAFLYETGARAGELSRLGTVAMDEAIREPAAAYLITLTGKTNDRDYLFTRQTAELWKLWCQVRPPECREYAIIGWGSGHAPARLLTNGISQMLIRRCQEAGVRPFRSHALRHAKVKRARQRVGLQMASLLVDHSDIATTEGYANVDDDELLAAAVATSLDFDLWGA